MAAEDVLSVLSVLREADVDIWIGGGWGIDALVGRQTRQHRDLDLMHANPAGREIDLHPLTFAPDGSAVQASPHTDRPFGYPARCFVTGRINGSVVPCLSAEQQVYFHQGYEPADHDRHDMAQLRGAFGIDTHF